MWCNNIANRQPGSSECPREGVEHSICRSARAARECPLPECRARAARRRFAHSAHPAHRRQEDSRFALNIQRMFMLQGACAHGKPGIHENTSGHPDVTCSFLFTLIACSFNLSYNIILFFSVFTQCWVFALYWTFICTGVIFYHLTFAIVLFCH